MLPTDQLMKLKPFDLQAALRGEPVCDGNGNVAAFICQIPIAHPDYKLVVVWRISETPFFYTEDGKIHNDSNEPILYMME